MSGLATPTRGGPRVWAITLSAALEIGVVALLWFGLAQPSGVRQALRDSIAAITLPSSPTPPVKPPPLPHHHAPAGRASPANVRSAAAPVFAAQQVLPVQAPVPVAPKTAVGTDAQSGAAPMPGPGSGAGGLGSGTGSGGSGTGSGDGGRDPEWTGGRIKSSDYPVAARMAEAQGTTSVTISVNAQGRANACRLVHSSRNHDLDAATCDLILKRFRFRPARDSAGQAVGGEVDYDQEWTLGSQLDP